MCFSRCNTWLILIGTVLKAALPHRDFCQSVPFPRFTWNTAKMFRAGLFLKEWQERAGRDAPFFRLNNALDPEDNDNFYCTIIVAHLAALFSGCDRLKVLIILSILFPFFRVSLPEIWSNTIRFVSIYSRAFFSVFIGSVHIITENTI